MSAPVLKFAVIPIFFCLLSGAVFGQSNSSSFITLRPATVLNTGDTISGPLPTSQPMHIVVALKLNNEPQLQAFIADPGHAELTPAQFTAQYSPTIAQAQAVADYLTQSGCQNVTISANRLLVSADCTAAVTEAAFQTKLVSVRTHSGRSAYANSSAISLPTSLQPTVVAVLGLQNVYIYHSFLAETKAGNTIVPYTSGGGSEVFHDPLDFPIIYNVSGEPTAAYTPVGVIAVCKLTQTLTDLSSFTTTEGLPTVTTRVINPQGCNQPNPQDQIEWDMDSQVIAAMGGAVQSMSFFDAASFNDSDLTTDYNSAVTDDVAKIINVSLGICENTAQSDGSAAADDQIFMEAQADDQTFSVAAGDYGADECVGVVSDSYPASSPYVTSVGGTELYTTGTTTWANETVWNDTYGATGGSPSTFEPQPSWQNGVGQNSGHNTRGVADIAFDASPNSGVYHIWIAGARDTNTGYGGTSLSSPIFVGMWARIRQTRGSSSGTLLTEPTGFGAEYVGCVNGLDHYRLSWGNEIDGLAAPMLYAVANTNYAATFHDVTSGNNNGENAATGWDYPTGFGSLIANQFVDTVATPTYVVEQRTGAGSWVQIYSGGLSSTTAKVAGGYVWEFRVQGQNGSLIGPWAYVYVSAPSCGGQ
ncbi:MAG TPA: S53 family peptidase [Gammaproteobacteria bacterium]|nr:S53 family peptidase [Gammaproteobacteria bacterium]